MDKLNKVLLLIVFLGFAISCDEDDDNEEEQVITENSISFNPPISSWHYRTQPDSIIIQINNGEPPFNIIERFEFAAQSSIRGRELIIYPNSTSGLKKYGADFIVIQDNSTKVSTFNVEVKNLTSYYSTIDSLYFNLSGDTSISFTNTRFMDSQWDRFNNFFDFSYSDDSFNNFYTFFKPNNNPGSNRYERTLELFVEIPYPRSFSTRLFLKDTMQTAEIIKLNTSEAQISLDVDLVDISGRYQNDFRLQCFIELSK